MICPCNSGLEYVSCCGPLLKGRRQAASPLELMRSRYVAYTEGNMAYIQKTMAGVAAEGFDPGAAKHQAKATTWLGLVVENHFMDPLNTDVGYVQFGVTYKNTHGIVQQMREKSTFRRFNGRWFYCDGEIPAKPGN